MANGWTSVPREWVENAGGIAKFSGRIMGEVYGLLRRHSILARTLPADADLLTGREFREAYLLPLAESSALKGTVHPQTTVVAVGRAGWRKTDPLDPKKPRPPFRLLLRDAKGAERFEPADAVLEDAKSMERKVSAALQDV